MKNLLVRLHVNLLAWVVKYFRTRRLVTAFASAHAEELRSAHPFEWPVIMARQHGEMKAIRAGKLDQTITQRKSWAFPFLPASIQRLSVPIMKATPYNLRRMSRTPVPRRAMNMIKGSMIAQPWAIKAIKDVDPSDGQQGQEERIRIGQSAFNHPNNDDSFQTFLEMGLEDYLTCGAFVAELRLTPDINRPFKMWTVNVESIRMFVDWTEDTPDKPRYAQMTGLKGERGAVLFYDDELMYLRDNPSNDTPFGIGCMEVAFQSVSSFLGVQDMAGRAGTDQIHKTFLWWEQPQNVAHYDIVRRHIQNELEGQAKLSLIGGMKKPEVVEVTPVAEADLLMGWQELLIRMIANAFNMSAMTLGVEHDINRAVGEVLGDSDFRSAVVPTAKRLQEAFTRRILHDRLGWYDLEFLFLSLDDPDPQTKMDMYSRMYGANAITPNEIREGMRMERSESPFADLTQFESMMVNFMAQQEMQERQADSGMARQQQMQEQMQPKQLPVPGGEEGEEEETPFGERSKQLSPGQPGMNKSAAPKAPQALKLPKFPITGSRYSAAQIARMPINRVTDVFAGTGLSAFGFLRAMDEQEPGILQTLSDEVKQFFEERLREEKKPRTKIAPALMKRWIKDLGIKRKKQDSREDEYSEYLRKGGAGYKQRNKDVGRAGNMNPIKRG